MIQPRSIAQLIGSSTLEQTKVAIAAELGRLFQGVKTVAHPGKLDINDVVAKSVVAAPGIAIGWTRLRAERDVDGGFRETVDWAAYIVVEDHVDLPTKRATKREAVGHAIGAALLAILDDPDHAMWGVAGVNMPAADPAPALTPVMTMRSGDNATDIYAVTWSQSVWDRGRSWFGGATPELTFNEATRELEAEFDDDLADMLPAPEVRAMLREAEGGA